MDKKSWNIYERRRATVKKKASSLSSLCDVDVCFLCFSPTGDFDSWPEDQSELRSVIEKFKLAHNNEKRLKRKDKLGLCDILDTKIKSLRKQLEKEPESSHLNGSLPLPLWDEELALSSKESLQALFGCLASKLRAVDDQIEFLKARESSQKPQELFPQPNLGLFDDCFSYGVNKVNDFFSEPNPRFFGHCYSVPDQVFLGPGLDQVPNFPEPFGQSLGYVGNDREIAPSMNNFGRTLKY